MTIVVTLFDATPNSQCGGLAEEIEITAEIVNPARATIARQPQTSDADAVSIGEFAVFETDRVNLVAATGQGFGLPLDPSVAGVRRVSDDQYSRHA